MVLLLPALIYLLALSIQSEQGFMQAADVVSSSLGKFIAVLLSWVLAHHLLAGIRFLLLDIDLGVTREMARKTAWLAHGLAVLIAIITAGIIF